MKNNHQFFAVSTVLAAFFLSSCGGDHGEMALKEYLVKSVHGNYSVLREGGGCGSFPDFCVEAVVRTQEKMAVGLLPALDDERDYLIGLANRFYPELHLSAEAEVFRGDFSDDDGCSDGCSITVIKSKSDNLYYINIFKT